MDSQEGIAVGRTFASMKNYQIDGNKEMVAVGSMNLAGSCASCYVTSGKIEEAETHSKKHAELIMEAPAE